uniref:Secreted protein n=1 Tax=Anguilla anguilla TaxID=7936 RepID=A0A0E9X780_ANGAN
MWSLILPFGISGCVNLLTLHTCMKTNVVSQGKSRVYMEMCTICWPVKQEHLSTHDAVLAVIRAWLQLACLGAGITTRDQCTGSLP